MATAKRRLTLDETALRSFERGVEASASKGEALVAGSVQSFERPGHHVGGGDTAGGGVTSTGTSRGNPGSRVAWSFPLSYNVRPKFPPVTEP